MRVISKVVMLEFFFDLYCDVGSFEISRMILWNEKFWFRFWKFWCLEYESNLFRVWSMLMVSLWIFDVDYWNIYEVSSWKYVYVESFTMLTYKIYDFFSLKYADVFIVEVERPMMELSSSRVLTRIFWAIFRGLRCCKVYCIGMF